MRHSTIIGLAIMTLLLGGAACSKQNNTANTNDTVNTAVVNTNTPATTNTATSTNVNESVSGSISITAPADNAELASGSPFLVTGTASGDTVYARVRNAAGTTLFTETTRVHTGAFSVHLTVNATHTSTATIEVFQKDTDDAETNLASVPVTFTLPSPATNSNTAVLNTNSDTNNSPPIY